jgi:Fe-S oxidoreductase
MMWRQVYPEWSEKLGIEYKIKTKHYSEVVSEKIKSGEFKFKKGIEKSITVTLHDSCHIGSASGVYDPPRDVIKAIPGVRFVEMSSNREKAHCCGSVLTLLKEPEVAADIGKIRLDEAIEKVHKKSLPFAYAASSS